MSYNVTPLDAMAMSIFMFEGGRSGNPSVRCIRNSNPGNLRPYMAGQKTDEDGYRIFPTFYQGWVALLQDLQTKLKIHLKPEQTLLDLMNLYAPAQDHNNPASYARFCCDWLSITLAKTITIDTPLKEIFNL